MSDFKDYGPRMMTRNRAPNGDQYARPSMDPDIVMTDQPNVFFNKRTGEYIKVPPVSNAATIFGLIPLLSGGDQGPLYGRK